MENGARSMAGGHADQQEQQSAAGQQQNQHEDEDENGAIPASVLRSCDVWREWRRRGNISIVQYHDYIQCEVERVAHDPILQEQLWDLYAEEEEEDFPTSPTITQPAGTLSNSSISTASHLSQYRDHNTPTTSAAAASDAIKRTNMSENLDANRGREPSIGTTTTTTMNRQATNFSNAVELDREELCTATQKVAPPTQTPNTNQIAPRVKPSRWGPEKSSIVPKSVDVLEAVKHIPASRNRVERTRSKPSRWGPPIANNVAVAAASIAVKQNETISLTAKHAQAHASSRAEKTRTRPSRWDTVPTSSQTNEKSKSNEQLIGNLMLTSETEGSTGIVAHISGRKERTHSGNSTTLQEAFGDLGLGEGGGGDGDNRPDNSADSPFDTHKKISDLHADSDEEDEDNSGNNDGISMNSPSTSLRDYQQRLYDDVLNQLDLTSVGINNYQSEVSLSQSVLVYLPTGGGKTVIASHLIQFFHAHKKRCMFVVNRTLLIEQTARALARTGFVEDEHIGYIKAGRVSNSQRPIQIASIQTFASRATTSSNKNDDNNDKEDDNYSTTVSSMSLPCADVVFLDEGHGAIAQQYEILRRTYPDALMIGLTATPFRSKHDEHLSAVFHRPISGPSVSLLINQGHLCPPVVFPRIGPPVTSRSVQNPMAIKQIVAKYLELCRLRKKPQQLNKNTRTRTKIRGDDASSTSEDSDSSDSNSDDDGADSGYIHRVFRPTIAFCCTVSHSKALVEAMNLAGVRSQHVDAKTSEHTREDARLALVRGSLDLLSSVNVLSEGFDVPCVSAVLMLRPTDSRGLYIQQVGRGLRTSHETGKRNCVVLDEVGNVYKHGPITGPLDYEWEAPTISTRANAISSSSHNGRTGTCSISSSGTTKAQQKQKQKTIKVDVRACRCGAVIHALLPACAACVRTRDRGRGERAHGGGKQFNSHSRWVGGGVGGRMSGRGRVDANVNVNANVNVGASKDETDELVASVSRLSVADRVSRH